MDKQQSNTAVLGLQLHCVHTVMWGGPNTGTSLQGIRCTLLNEALFDASTHVLTAYELSEQGILQVRACSVCTDVRAFHVDLHGNTPACSAAGAVQ